MRDKGKMFTFNERAHMLPTPSWLAFMLAKTFGKKMVMADVSPDGVMKTTAYQFRGQLYFVKEEWTPDTGDLRGYSFDAVFIDEYHPQPLQ